MSKKKKINTVISLFFSILFLISIFSSTTTFAILQNNDKTIFIDDDNIIGPWEGTIDHPYQTISTGIRNAKNNDMIYVYNGTYRENIFINKNVKIHGENKNHTYIIGSIYIQETDSVMLSDLTINAPSLEETNIGISIDNSKNTLISNSIITNQSIGLLLTNKTETTIIKENIIKKNDIGIDICTSSNNIIYGNLINDNQISNIILYFSQKNLITQNIIKNSKHNLQFHTTKASIINNNYWGEAKKIQVLTGYQTIHPFNIVIPWIKVLFHPLTEQDQQMINPLAVMNTSHGAMIFELFRNKMPITTTNFINLTQIDFFDNLVFHRVMENFVIQGGGYDANGTLKESPFGPIPLETHPDITHKDGVLSMARTSDPNSATSQFFICDEAHHYLDGDYAAFGEMLIGFDTLRSIASVKTTEKNQLKDWPIEEVLIFKLFIF